VANMARAQPRQDPGRKRSSMLAAALPICAAVMLTACTATMHNQPPKGARTNTCHELRTQATRLVLHRVNLNSKAFTQKFAIPAVMTADDSRTIRSLAQTLCALPVLPSNEELGCAGGISYTLAFTTRARILSLVTLAVTGCNDVEGLGGSGLRLYPAHSKLWLLLGRAIGIPHATQETFAGSKPQPR
jgi:hypothetical protein